MYLDHGFMDGEFFRCEADLEALLDCKSDMRDLLSIRQTVLVEGSGVPG